LLIFLAVVLVVSMVAFAACKAEEAPPVVEEEAPPVVEEEEEPPPVEPPWEWPEKLAVASQGPATPGYPIDIAWTTPLAEDTGMKVRLITEEDLLISFTWLKQGLLDLGFADMGATLVPAGLGRFATRDLGPCQTRIFWPHGRGGRGFAVRGDSGIKTPYDIKPGMKIIYHSEVLTGPLGRMWVAALLAWAQVDPEDVEWVEAASIPATFELLKAGRGDVVVGWPSSPPWVELEASPHGLAWIELNAEEDPEGAARLFEVDPSACFGVMTKGCPSAIGVRMLVTIPSMVVWADKDPELIYHLVKWLDENHDLYKDGHPYCADMTLDALMELAEKEFVPLHDGTVKYLEEKGLWTPAHEARRQQNIELLNRYEQAYAEALDMADEQGITVDPTNEEWLELWENYKKELNLPGFKLFVTFP